MIFSAFGFAVRGRQPPMFGGASGGGGNNMIKDVGSHSEQNRRFRDYMEVSDDGTA